MRPDPPVSGAVMAVDSKRKYHFGSADYCMIYSSLKSHRPSLFTASLYLSATFCLSSRSASSLSAKASCVVGISIRQNPGGLAALSLKSLCFPYWFAALCALALMSNSRSDTQSILFRRHESTPRKVLKKLPISILTNRRGGCA